MLHGPWHATAAWRSCGAAIGAALCVVCTTPQSVQAQVASEAFWKSTFDAPYRGRRPHRSAAASRLHRQPQAGTADTSDPAFAAGSPSIPSPGAQGDGVAVVPAGVSPLVTGSLAPVRSETMPARRAPGAVVARNGFIADVGLVARLEPSSTGRSGQPAGRVIEAAHAHFPFGSTVLVTDEASGRSVLVKIVDRPRSDRAAIKLSPAALDVLAATDPAAARVRVRMMLVWQPTGEPTFFPTPRPRALD